MKKLGHYWFHKPIVLNGKKFQAHSANGSYVITIDDVVQKDYTLCIRCLEEACYPDGKGLGSSREVWRENTNKKPWSFCYMLKYNGRKVMESVYPKVVMRSLLNAVSSPW